MKLTEDLSKLWLKGRGLPVPEGLPADGPEEVEKIARKMGSRVVVKALVAAGRRGKAGAVQLANDPSSARAAAERIFGSNVAGRNIERVYVEHAVDIAEELYLSFAFGTISPQVVVSRLGGVDIEETAASNPAAIITCEIDPQRGLAAWQAADLWDRAGVQGALVPKLAALTVELYRAFRDADALMLEVNPLAVTTGLELSIVGAMMEIDENALFRHAEWERMALEDAGPGGRPLNERERDVKIADKRYPGGAIRYTELDGNIGLLVSGGGAGLLQHDLMLAAGGRPANHSDTSPSPTPEKPAAILEAIFSNPNARGLLIGYNYLQLAPCDLVIQALLLAMERCKVDPRRFPIVIRLFGPNEAEARRLVSRIPGIRYLPNGASLADGIGEIVAAVNRLPQGTPA